MAATPLPRTWKRGRSSKTLPGPRRPGPWGPLTSTRSLMFWPNTNLLLGASALLAEFSRLRRRRAVSAGVGAGDRRRSSRSWPTGFCSGHEVWVTKVTLGAKINNPTEHGFCLRCPPKSTVLTSP